MGWTDRQDHRQHHYAAAITVVVVVGAAVAVAMVIIVVVMVDGVISVRIRTKVYHRVYQPREWACPAFQAVAATTGRHRPLPRHSIRTIPVRAYTVVVVVCLRHHQLTMRWHRRQVVQVVVAVVG